MKHDDAVAGETVEAAAARARKLARQKGRSGWPEFAVKVGDRFSLCFAVRFRAVAAAAGSY